MSEQAPVYTTFNGQTGVARIVFNRPDVLNAIDLATAEAFRDAAMEVTGKDGVRAIILAGEGRAFVAGGDVAGFAADLENAPQLLDGLLDAMHPGILALRTASAPVVAAVRGVAAGGGFSLMLGADYVVADDAARFLIAYDQIGATPDCGGTWFLPRKVGRARAFELMLTGKALDAQTALAYGLVNELVSADQVEARAAAVAEKIARGPTRAYGAFKALLNADIPFEDHLEAERTSFRTMTQTADFKEGVTAFVEKRKPDFKGE